MLKSEILFEKATEKIDFQWIYYNLDLCHAENRHKTIFPLFSAQLRLNGGFNNDKQNITINIQINDAAGLFIFELNFKRLAEDIRTQISQLSKKSSILL